MNTHEIAQTILDDMLPFLDKKLEGLRDVEQHFQSIKKIILIENCSISVNEEEQDYDNQSILQFVFSDRTVYFDLIDCCVLDSTSKIVEGTGKYRVLCSKDSYNILIYSADELLEILKKAQELDCQLKNLKYTTQQLSALAFQDMLEKRYTIKLLDPYPYIEMENFKLFVDVDLETKDIKWTGKVSLFKQGEWLDAIQLEEELNKVKDTLYNIEEVNNGSTQEQ